MPAFLPLYIERMYRLRRRRESSEVVIAMVRKGRRWRDSVVRADEDGSMLNSAYDLMSRHHRRLRENAVKLGGGITESVLQCRKVSHWAQRM